MQGIKWVLKREEANDLRIVQLTHPKFADTVIHCIENGLPLLIENLPEDIDPMLDSVIQKKVSFLLAVPSHNAVMKQGNMNCYVQILNRGRSQFLKLGDVEIEYNSRFRLYLQTKLRLDLQSCLYLLLV